MTQRLSREEERARRQRAKAQQKGIVPRHNGAPPIRAKCGKIPYFSEASAKGALAATKVRTEDDRRKEQRTYQCPKCGFFHLTSLEEWSPHD